MLKFNFRYLLLLGCLVIQSISAMDPHPPVPPQQQSPSPQPLRPPTTPIEFVRQDQARRIYHIKLPPFFQHQPACGWIAVYCFKKMHAVLNRNPQAPIATIIESIQGEGVPATENEMLVDIIDVVQQDPGGAIATTELGGTATEPKTLGAFLASQQTQGDPAGLGNYLSQPNRGRFTTSGGMLNNFIEKKITNPSNHLALNYGELGNTFYGDTPVQFPFQSTDENIIAPRERETAPGGFTRPNLIDFFSNLATKISLGIIPYVLIFTDAQWPPTGHWMSVILRKNADNQIEVICCESLNDAKLSDVTSGGESFISILYNNVLSLSNDFFAHKKEIPIHQIAQEAVDYETSGSGAYIVTDLDKFGDPTFEKITLQEFSSSDIREPRSLEDRRDFLPYLQSAIQAFKLQQEQGMLHNAVTGNIIKPETPGFLVLPCGHVSTIQDLTQKILSVPIFKELGYAPAIKCGNPTCNEPISHKFISFAEDCMHRTEPNIFRKCTALAFDKGNPLLAPLKEEPGNPDQQLIDTLKQIKNETLPVFIQSREKGRTFGLSCTVNNEAVADLLKTVIQDQNFGRVIENQDQFNHFVLFYLMSKLGPQLSDLTISLCSGIEKLLFPKTEVKRTPPHPPVTALFTRLSGEFDRLANQVLKTISSNATTDLIHSYIERLILQGISLSQCIQLFESMHRDSTKFLTAMRKLDAMLSEKVNQEPLRRLQQEILNGLIGKQLTEPLFIAAKALDSPLFQDLIDRGNEVRAFIQDILRDPEANLMQ